MADSNPDAVKLLTDDEVAEIEARLKVRNEARDLYYDVIRLDSGEADRLIKVMHQWEEHEAPVDVPALCATVRALRSRTAYDWAPAESLLRDPVKVRVLPTPIVTRDGVPCEDQAAALEEFKERCRAVIADEGERPLTPSEVVMMESDADMERDCAAPDDSTRVAELSDDEVAELCARPSTELGGYRRVLLRPRERDALCATVRALRTENEKLNAIVTAYENQDEEALEEAENL